MKQDDIFHDVIMTEEINQQQGYEEGRKSGRHQGFQMGNKLGWEKGAAIGSEVGFYAGFAKSLLEEMTMDAETKSRIIKTLEKIVVLVETFPLSDPHDIDLHAKLEQLRTKYKQHSMWHYILACYNDGSVVNTDCLSILIRQK